MRPQLQIALAAALCDMQPFQNNEGKSVGEISDLCDIRDIRR